MLIACLFSGIHETHQKKSLEMMEDLVKHMYFRNEKGNLCKKPFQEGISVSIKSTLAFYDELNK